MACSCIFWKSKSEGVRDRRREESDWRWRQRPDHQVPCKAVVEFGISPNGSREDGMWRRAGRVACVDRSIRVDGLRYQRHKAYIEQLGEKAGWTGKDSWGSASPRMPTGCTPLDVSLLRSSLSGGCEVWQHSTQPCLCKYLLRSVLPGGSDGEEPACNAGRPRFDAWVGKILWRRKWKPTPVFLPGEFPGQRSLTGHSLWGHKELDMTEQLTLLYFQGKQH